MKERCRPRSKRGGRFDCLSCPASAKREGGSHPRRVCGAKNFYIALADTRALVGSGPLVAQSAAGGQAPPGHGEGRGYCAAMAASSVLIGGINVIAG